MYIGWILAFEDGPAALRSCSPVCRAMCAAARNPRCWPDSMKTYDINTSIITNTSIIYDSILII